MPFLLNLIPWRLVTIGAALLLVVLSVLWLRQKIVRLEDENAHLYQTAVDLKASALAQAIKTEEMRKAAARDMQAVADSLETARMARSELSAKKGRISSVPVADDEHAAAVLQRALECVRDPATCTSDDRGGEGAGSGAPVDPSR